MGLLFISSPSVSSGVPAGLRDLRHGGEDAGGQGPQPGEAAAGAAAGDPGGDPGALPGGPQALYQRVGRGGMAAGHAGLTRCSANHKLSSVSGGQSKRRSRSVFWVEGENVEHLLRRVKIWSDGILQCGAARMNTPSCVSGSPPPGAPVVMNSVVVHIHLVLEPVKHTRNNSFIFHITEKQNETEKWNVLFLFILKDVFWF